MVTPTADRDAALGRSPRPVLDPEVPVLTIEDLGILRDVTEDDQRPRRT